MSGWWRENLAQLARYPSAVTELAIVALLIGISIHTVIAIPYSEALNLWRGGEQWQMHPANARPVWVNWSPARSFPARTS
jgi:peptide/nickel transport system permease protein